MNVISNRLYRYLVSRIFGEAHTPLEPQSNKDKTLLMDNNGVIRPNYDNPEVKKRLLQQLQTAANISLPKEKA